MIFCIVTCMYNVLLIICTIKESYEPEGLIRHATLLWIGRHTTYKSPYNINTEDELKFKSNLSAWKLSDDSPYLNLKLCVLHSRANWLISTYLIFSVNFFDHYFVKKLSIAYGLFLITISTILLTKDRILTKIL